MKIYKLLASAFLIVGFASCQQTLFEDLEGASVNVVADDNVSYDGKVITVKKNCPVTFGLEGEPDVITFFSGELEHQYAYRNRTEIPLEDIVSAELKFKIWAQYGIFRTDPENSCKNQMDVLFVTENENGEPVFPGLSRDFEADSVMLEEQIPWQQLVGRSEMPVKSTDAYNAKEITKDLTAYIGKKLTLALVLNRDKKEAPQNSTSPNETILQSTFHFEDMRIETTLKDNRTMVISADAFGLTPVNMKNKTVFADHKDNEFDMPSDMEYGAVKKGVEGYWNLANLSSGNIDISGCPANEMWKYSWLVSDYINWGLISGADTGVKIKEINLPMSDYAYTYSQVGTYRATFVLTNSNYEESQQKLCEFIVNVVE